MLATEGTVRGGAYERAIKTFNSHAQVLSLACPLLVALAEEGLVSGPIVELVARRYLAPITVTPVDTVVLGCTHFPVFLPVLQSLLTPEHRWVDSAATTALAVRATLASLRLLAQEGLADPRAVRFLATDGAERFARVGSLFYGEAIPESAVEVVDLA